MSRSFSKPALLLTEQVALLQERGMHVADVSKAAFYLGQINYYRLGAYWLPYEVDHTTHRFQDGTTFDEVLEARLQPLNRLPKIPPIPPVPPIPSINRIGRIVRIGWHDALDELVG